MKKKQFRPSAAAGYARVKQERDDALAKVASLTEALDTAQAYNRDLSNELVSTDRKAKQYYELKTDVERESAALRNGRSVDSKRMSTLLSDNRALAKLANKRWWWSAIAWTTLIITIGAKTL